jgi:hypothetical protein
MTPTQQTGFRRLATFWLDNLPPINLWSLQELRINPFAAPYKLNTLKTPPVRVESSDTEDQPPEKEQPK